MKILFAGDNDVADYLKEAGHQVKHLYANDFALKTASEFKCEVVVYFSSVQEVINHEDAIRELQDNGIRVVLVVEKNDPLLIYATALGVTDVLIYPVSPEDILDLIVNPAKASDTADLVHECWQNTSKKNLDKSTQVTDHAEIPIKNTMKKSALIKKEQKDTSKKLTFRLPFINRFSTKTPVIFVSHPIITVWNPTGTNKSITALNLAVTAASRGFDVALIELDLACPLLDRWFKIPQTAVANCGNGIEGAGIMTLGENLMPSHISKLFCESWGVHYLAAGNKLGNIGTPDLTLENMEQTIRTVYQRDVSGKPAVTIIDAGTSFEWPNTFAALKQATVILVPLDGSPQEAELVEQQLAELKRVGVKPKTVEALWEVPGMTKVKQVCESRLTVMVDTPGYLKASAGNKPYCLSDTGREVWERVLEELL